MADGVCDELWQLEARKLGGDRLVNVIVELRDGQNKILERLDGMENRHKASEDALKLLGSAFPDGDFAGHNRYHKYLIDKLEERRKLRIAIQEKTISGLVWAAVVGLGLAVWHELQRVFGFPQ